MKRLIFATYSLIWIGCVSPAFADVVGVSPDKLDFGSVVQGLSTVLTVTMTNGTHKALTIAPSTITGDFSVDSNACPALLATGGSCTIRLRFSPAATGLRSGTFSVFDDANNSPQKVKLSGYGIAPTLVSIQVTPAIIAAPIGGAQPFTAFGSFDNGTSQDLTSSVTWSSSDPIVATISTTGLAQGVGSGWAILTASAGSVGASARIMVAPAGFSPTGSMTFGRYLHTATTLPDGRVLIAGGYADNGQPRPLPEVYDPLSGSFSLTGGMVTDRLLHTATLLLNGKVLLTGGTNSSIGVLATAELYDPVAGTFALTGSMNTIRYRHTATLLSDGRVLIAGGNNQLGEVASAELYDPNTGLFTPVGSMSQAREEHAATLLGDGRVLVAGGHCLCGSSQATATAELFDPATLTFQPTGSLLEVRMDPSAALLPNGTVLVAAGGAGPPPLPANAEVYDPRTGQFTPGAPMVNPRDGHTFTVLSDGRILLAGGVDAGGHPLATGELYDPTVGSFVSIPGFMSVTRQSAAAALLPSGAVLIVGGFDAQMFSTTADVFVAAP